MTGVITVVMTRKDGIITGIRGVMTQEIGADTQKTRSNRPCSWKG